MAKRIIFTAVVLIFFRTFVHAGDDNRTLSPDIAMFSAIHDSMTEVAKLVDLVPYERAELERSLAVIDSAKKYMTLAQQNAGYKAILRAEGSGYWLSVKHLQSSDSVLYRALQFVKKTANDPIIDSMLQAIGRDNLTAPVYKFQKEQLEASLKQSQVKLDRYEKKYGPKSARLNLAEAAVNLFVLRGCSLFGTGENGPGPLEFISAYSSSYVTAYDAEAKKTFDDIGVVSAFEIGLRYYFLREGWGEEGFCNILCKPGFATAGLLITGEEAGFLKSPFRGKEALGFFISWGGLKAGYTGGDNSRILLSRQFQVVPYLF